MNHCNNKSQADVRRAASNPNFSKRTERSFGFQFVIRGRYAQRLPPRDIQLHPPSLQQLCSLKHTSWSLRLNELFVFQLSGQLSAALWERTDCLPTVCERKKPTCQTHRYHPSTPGWTAETGFPHIVVINDALHCKSKTPNSTNHCEPWVMEPGPPTKEDHSSCWSSVRIQPSGPGWG